VPARTARLQSVFCLSRTRSSADGRTDTLAHTKWEMAESKKVMEEERASVERERTRMEQERREDEKWNECLKRFYYCRHRRSCRDKRSCTCEPQL
jgi:hypothetical protein